MTMYLNEFEQYMRKQVKSPEKTISGYMTDIKQLLKFASKDVISVVRCDMEKWIEHMNEIHKSTTTNRKISAIQTFWKWLEFKGVCEDIAKELPRPKKEEKHYETIPLEQINDIIDLCNTKYKTIVLFGCDSGLRISEPLSLELSDINFYTHEFTVRKSKRDKTRVVPMTERLEACLKQYIEEENVTEGKLFTMKENGVRDYLKKRYEKVGLVWNQETGHVYHSLRHSFATELLDNGENPKVVADLLGDKVSTVMENYAHSSRKSRNNAIGKLGR